MTRETFEETINRLHANYNYSENELKERRKLIRYILLNTTVDELCTFSTEYLRDLLEFLEG